MSYRTTAALAVLLLVSIAGCTTAPLNRANELIVAQQREPMALNPALENGTSSTEWGLLLFQYLVKFDDRGGLVGDAAREAPSLQNGGISRDGLTITYHLRAGLRFADGAALTARDCVWSIEAINNPQNNVQSRYGYDRIIRAEAPNATTLVLHLRSPFAPLLTLLLAPQGFPILPQHLLARYRDFNHLAFNAKPIGSGPYQVVNWQHGDHVEMRPNPYYAQRPRVTRLTIRFVPDPNTAVNLLQTGEIGGFFNDEDLGNYPTLQSIRSVRVTSTPINAVGAIIFNTQDPLTRDPRVRHAIAEAIDMPAMIAKAYRGALTSRAAGRGLFIWAYSQSAYPDIPTNPADAARLLDAAGWKLGSDGVRQQNGKPLELLFIIQAQTPGDQIIGNFVAEAERKIGIAVTLKQYNITQFVAPANLGGPVYGGKFQMALYPFVNGDDPDATDQFACRNVPPNGYNKSRICDPQIDALLRSGRETYDMGKRKQIYTALQRRLYAELPIALIYQRRQVNAFSKRLRGQTTSLSGAFWNVAQWRL